MEAIGRHRGMRMFVAAFGAVLLLLSPVAVVRAGEPVPLLAYAARIAGDDARTRLVIEFDREPAFSIHYVANPVRVIVDLPETSFGLKPESLQPRGLFDAIRYGGMGGRGLAARALRQRADGGDPCGSEAGGGREGLSPRARC
ncbi:AMIN domain-containing protein [Sinorhizobium meliloti]|nr:AMIN domain-containing protein [Sinorhizobium meliloti]